MSCEMTEKQQDDAVGGLVAVCVILTCMVVAVVIAYAIDGIKAGYRAYNDIVDVDKDMRNE